MIKIIKNISACGNIKNIIFIAAMLFFVSCKNDFLQFLNKPVVQIGDKALFEEDLNFLFYDGISQDDSILVRNNYIENWIKEMLLYEKAINNIKNRDEIEELIEKYRRALMIYEYQLQ